MRLYTCVYVCVHMHVCACMYCVQVCICLCMYMYVCVCIYHESRKRTVKGEEQILKKREEGRGRRGTRTHDKKANFAEALN